MFIAFGVYQMDAPEERNVLADINIWLLPELDHLRRYGYKHLAPLEQSRSVKISFTLATSVINVNHFEVSVEVECG